MHDSPPGLRPAAASNRPDDSHVAVLLLAAGASTRLGQPKQLLPFGDTTVLRHMAQVAVDTGLRAAVVLGCYADALAPQLADMSIQIIVNPDWHTGMGSSLKAGLRALFVPGPPPGAGPGAVIVLLGDQVFVTADHLRRLAAAHHSTGAPLVAAAYAGTVGVPALFATGLYPELLALPDASGAKPVLARHRKDAATVPLPEAAFDLDTPADVRALHERPMRQRGV